MVMNKYAVRTITCKGCGKTLTKRLRPHQEYCSLECYRKSERPQRKNGKTIVCETCGESFYVPANRVADNARFCSVECANKWQGRNKLTYTCKTCGKSFLWSPSRAKWSKVIYCSLECRDKDPERSAMLLRMNVNQQKISPNKLERAGFAILDSLSVEYVKQYTVNGKFSVDAFVPSANLAVQFDGEYWHGHPSKYDAQDKRQQRRIRLDHSQDAYMHQCGIRVIRFWESDVLRNPDHVRQSLLAVIQP